MGRYLMSLIALGAFIAQPAAAQMAKECASVSDQQAFEVQALKSELMVLTMSCQKDNDYNAFVRRYQPELRANEAAFDAYFKKAYGRRAQAEHDAYITALANAQSDQGTKLGSDFCPRNSAMFSEVMALQSGTQLPEYVAAKDLVPPTLGACAVAPPVEKAVAHGRATARHAVAKKH
jgi:hypothetical protein